jgi:hypothetical protein
VTKGKKSQRKKQERALRKRAQRKLKLARRETQAAAMSSPAQLIRQARNYPIEGCWVQRAWQDYGLAFVLVARTQPDGDLIIGDYLVDYYCLGVRHTDCRAGVPPGRFHNEVLPRFFRGQPPLEISPALAHEIVYGAIEFAARFEFSPHRDFKLSSYVLDPPDAHPRTAGVEFGKDGRPVYVEGPHDNANAILARLGRSPGDGNFDYVAADGMAQDSAPADDDAEGEVRSPLWVPTQDADDGPRTPLWTPDR